MATLNVEESDADVAAALADCEQGQTKVLQGVTVTMTSKRGEFPKTFDVTAIEGYEEPEEQEAPAETPPPAPPGKQAMMERAAGMGY